MDIIQSLKSFGLDDKEQQIYLLLLKHNWLTTLQLARKSSIKRTTLYRVLETLSQKGFVETKVDDKTTYYNAADPQQLESVVLEQETKAKKLRDSFPDLKQSLKLISSVKPKDTSIRFYRGTRGLKQLEWKRCNTPNSQIFILDAGGLWYKHLGNKFAETIRNEVVEKNIKVFEIANKEKAKSIPDNAEVSWSKNKTYVINHYQGRFISEKIINLTQDIFILKDAVHIHGYQENDILGIEIASTNFASLMQQIFKVLWNQAEVLDNFGGKNF